MASLFSVIKINIFDMVIRGSKMPELWAIAGFQYHVYLFGVSKLLINSSHFIVEENIEFPPPPRPILQYGVLYMVF